jgi:hypothetical protein
VLQEGRANSSSRSKTTPPPILVCADLRCSHWIHPGEDLDDASMTAVSEESLDERTREIDILGS